MPNSPDTLRVLHTGFASIALSNFVGLFVWLFAFMVYQSLYVI